MIQMCQFAQKNEGISRGGGQVANQFRNKVFGKLSFKPVIASSDKDDNAEWETECFLTNLQSRLMFATKYNLPLLQVGLLTLFGSGCSPTQPLRHLSVQQPPSLPSPSIATNIDPVHAKNSPTTLDDLLEIAVQHHPDLRAAQARVEIARGRMIQAGLYPNPSFGPNFSQLGNGENALGEAGARLTQTIVTGNKIRIAKEAAARGVEAADWQAMTRRHDLVTRVRSAYFELLTARREQEALNKIVDFSAKGLDAAERISRAGAGNETDVLRATVELEQNKLKSDVSAQRVFAARQNLFTAIGRPATVVLDDFQIDPVGLDQPAPVYDWQTMVACLRDTSSELHEARSLIAQQENLLRKVRADARPNIDVTAIPFYASYAHEMRAGFIVTAPIPVFDRNQGNIHAAQNEVSLAIAGERQLELRLTERLSGAYQRYQSALKQVEAYKKSIVPGAEKTLKLVKAGFEGNDKKYDYTAVLQAQQVLAQAQLAQTQAIGDLWRSIVEIAGILQQDDLQSGCEVREPQGVRPQFGSPRTL